MKISAVIRRSILLLLLTCSHAVATDIAPFSSDGCSRFPDGTLKQQELWLSCCRAHDYAYWKGGSFEERVEADEALKACVADTGEGAIALLMYAGVRLGGDPHLATDFRWGYGWPMGRGYKALSAEEKAAVERSESDSGKSAKEPKPSCEEPCGQDAEKSESDASAKNQVD